MKLFVLVCENEVISCCKTNPFRMIIDYFKKNKIDRIISQKDFAPWNYETGIYLVGDDNDFELWECVDYGWVMKNIYYHCLKKLKISQIDIIDNVDDDKSNLMIELKAKAKTTK